MLWGLNNSADLYLGISVTVARRFDGELAFHQHSPTMPIDLRLADIAGFLDDSHPTSSSARPVRKKRLRIWLGSGQCPLVQFALPEGVSSHGEISALTRAAAAAQLEMPPEQVLCQAARRNVGTAAAMPLRLWNQLATWADSTDNRFVSIQPLWSAATQCNWAREKSVLRVRVEEPDGITDVQPPVAPTLDDETLGTATLHMTFSPNTAQDAVATSRGGPSAFDKLWVRR